MNGEAATEKLAVALYDVMLAPGGERLRVPDLAAALLPVVREIAADELREAADELSDGRPWVTYGALHDRADALTGTTP